MKTQFNLLSQFLKAISFEAPNVPELFFQQGDGSAKLEINVDLQVKEADNNLYMVDMIVAVHSKLEDSQKSVFDIECIYAGLVQLENAEDDETKRRTLLIDVPQLLFPSVRQLIETLTSESGFPPFRMQQVDFNALYESKQKLEDDESFDERDNPNEGEKPDDDTPFDYTRWAKETAEEMTGEEDFKRYIENCGELPARLTDLSCYKNYFRFFFQPVKYKTPDWADEEDFDWGILLQILAGSITYGYALDRDENEQLPELLYVENEGDDTGCISKLSRGEVRDLMDSLLMGSLGVASMLYKEKISINAEIAEKLSKLNRIPTFEEFLSVYGISKNDGSEAEIILNSLYEQLIDYDQQTYCFRGQSEIDDIFEQ